MLFTPVLKTIISHFSDLGKIWLTPPTISQFKWVFIEFAGNKVLAFMFIALALFSVGWLVCEYWRGNRNDDKRGVETLHATSLHSRFLVFLSSRLNLNYLLILLLWAFLPVILGYIISQFNPVFYPRYYLYSSVGLYLFLSYLFSAVNLKPLYKAFIFAPIVIFSAFTLDLSPSKGEDWKQALPEIVKEKNDSTAVIVSAWYQYRPFTYYYNREYFRNYENTIELLKKDNIHCIDKASALANIELQPFTKIILVQSHQPVADPENTLYKYFSEKYKLVRSNGYEGIKVTLFRRQ